MAAWWCSDQQPCKSVPPTSRVTLPEPHGILHSLVNSGHLVWSGSSAWFDSNGGCVTSPAHLIAFLAISLCMLDDILRTCRKLVNKVRKGVMRMAEKIRDAKWMVYAVSSGFLAWTRQDERNASVRG